MIPNIIHFIYGLDPSFGGKPFMLCHYLAIKSAFEINRPEKIYFVYAYEPQTEWFEKARPYVELVQIVPPKQIFGRSLHHFAHMSDVIRLERLLEYGGIYLDLDTICVRSLAPMLGHRFVMGEEYEMWQESPDVPIRPYFKGLCNAVILSESDAPFLRTWYESYREFRSAGKDAFWSEHSVEIPGKIAETSPDTITRLGQTAFFFPSWDEAGINAMFHEDLEFPEAYLHHLWESVAWKYLERLTPESILTENTTYNRIARRFL